MHQKQDERRPRLRRQAELHGERRDVPGVEQQLAAPEHRIPGQLLPRLHDGPDGIQRPRSLHVPQLLSKPARET